MGTCIICGESCLSEIILTNNTSCHRHCVDDLDSRLTLSVAQKESLESRRRDINSSIAWSETILYQIVEFFGGKTVNRLLLAKEGAEIDLQINNLQNSIALVGQQLTGLYDYWPDYPPDWSRRRALAKSKAVRCDHCKRFARVLHTHHKVPMSRGGSHLPDNLMVLCEKCHESAHRRSFWNGGKMDVTYRPGQSTNGITELMPDSRRGVLPEFPKHAYRPTVPQLIERAIHNKRLLHFDYTRFDGARSTRTIRPYEVISVVDSLCVTGYCYLRDDKRTFAIQRMRNIVEVSETGECRDLE